MNRHVTRGFTLIELLVVVTIIVILIALLLPAMDKAMYQAELTVCGAKLHGIGMAMISYTSQFKRMYPKRVGAAWPMQICNGASNDDRPLLRQYLSINKSLRCPLSGEWDLENGTRDAANRLELTYSSYLMWFNFVYTGLPTGPEKAMRKLGDRFTYMGDSFSVLAHDSDVVGTTGTITLNAHQDSDAVMAEWTQRHEPYPGTGFITTSGHNYSFWWWRNYTAGSRGTVDNNYLYDDGSVRRITGVKFLKGNDLAAADQAGFALLPMHPTDAHAWRNLVPLR